MADRTLIFDFQNTKPIELSELTGALSALADQFKRFAAEEDGVDAQARLFIHEIRSGSVIAELIAMAQLASDLYEARDQLAGFLPALADAVNAIRHLLPESKSLDRRTVRNINNIVAPIAVDAGAQLNLIDNRGGVVNQTFVITPEEAATVRHNAQHLLNSQFPDETRFENEPMTLFQMRNAPPGKTGDYGIIDRFSTSAKKLTFSSDAAKDAILHHDGNPFEQIFWVSGVVKTAGGSVVGYLIHELLDVSPRDA